MHRTRTILIFLLMFLPVLLYSQEGGASGDDPSVEDDWEIYETDLYTAGDQTLTISLGTIFPAVFVRNGEVIEHNFNPQVGGIGTLSLNYFLGAHTYVGGEISFSFIPTIGLNMLYLVPTGIRAGYQFILWRFEFPLNISLGITWHRYLNLSYFGLYLKGGAAVYFRFSSEWSFGVDSAWCWFPEWTEDRQKNVDGNIVNLTLSARYHF